MHQKNHVKNNNDQTFNSQQPYNLIPADHPSNNKRGGVYVYIYYHESLAVPLVKNNYLNECLLCEVSFNNKKGYIAFLYKSPA